MAIQLNTAETSSRLEDLQKKRLKLVEDIEKVDMFHTDCEITNVYLNALNAIEKQELYKHKHESDKEDTVNDQEIAKQAIAMELEIRNRKRSGELNMFDTPDATASIPTLDTSNITDGTTADLNATETTKGDGEDWDEFRRKMIMAGHDPNYKVDDQGNIIRIKKEGE